MTLTKTVTLYYIIHYIIPLYIHDILEIEWEWKIKAHADNCNISPKNYYTNSKKCHNVEFRLTYNTHCLLHK